MRIYLFNPEINDSITECAVIIPEAEFRELVPIGRFHPLWLNRASFTENADKFYYHEFSFTS